MSKRAITIWLVIIIVLILYVANLSTKMRGGSGVVLHLGDGQPIENAKVVLRCEESQFHGSITKKEIIKYTDKQGRFTFSMFEAISCDHGYVDVFKEGYIETSHIDARYSSLDFENVPDIIYVTLKSEERLQKIKQHIALSSGRSNNLPYQYLIIFSEFIKAKNIALNQE